MGYMDKIADAYEVRGFTTYSYSPNERRLIRGMLNIYRPQLVRVNRLAELHLNKLMAKITFEEPVSKSRIALMAIFQSMGASEVHARKVVDFTLHLIKDLKVIPEDIVEEKIEEEDLPQII